VYNEKVKKQVVEMHSVAKVLIAGIAKPETVFAILKDTMMSVCLSRPS
jgi:tetraacyldisaccharide-1-P 4'-kinase